MGSKGKGHPMETNYFLNEGRELRSRAEISNVSRKGSGDGEPRHGVGRAHGQDRRTASAALRTNGWNPGSASTSPVSMGDLQLS